jgi:hypothetical protein
VVTNHWLVLLNRSLVWRAMLKLGCVCTREYAGPICGRPPSIHGLGHERALDLVKILKSKNDIFKNDVTHKYRSNRISEQTWKASKIKDAITRKSAYQMNCRKVVKTEKKYKVIGEVRSGDIWLEFAALRRWVQPSCTVASVTQRKADHRLMEFRSAG